MNFKKYNLIEAVVLSIIFIVGISTPLVVMLLSEKKEMSHVEKRKLEEEPSLSLFVESISDYTKKYEKYFNDHFGMRTKFVELYNSFFINLFETSPNFNVIVGKDKWLYFATCFALQDFTGNYLSSSIEIKRWKQILLDREQWLGEYGIRYLFLPVPYKISVYPEYLPNRLQNIEGLTNLDQLLNTFKEPPIFSNVLDFKTVFKSHGKDELLYYKTDTHWNSVGGYVAYREIINHISKWFPELEPMPRELLGETRRLKSGNMTNWLNIGKMYKEDVQDLHIPRKDEFIQKGEYILPDTPVSFMQEFRKGRASYRENKTQELTAIVITDSFETALKEYLALHFRRIVFVRDARLEDMVHLIKKEKPDIVFDMNGSVRLNVAFGESVEIRNEVIKKHLAKSKILLQVTPENIKESIKEKVDIDIIESDLGPHLKLNGFDPQLIFTNTSNVSQSKLYVKCVLKSPVDTLFSVYYQTEKEPKYTASQRVSAKVQKGENEIYIRILDRAMIDTIRVDIGGQPGLYRIEELVFAELKH